MNKFEIIKDNLKGNIYLTDEDIKKILIEKMIYEPAMDQYFPELIDNVEKAVDTITELVDKHIMHKLNNHPYCWDTSKLSLQVENIEDLCNTNYPEGQKAAKEVNDRVIITIKCDDKNKEVKVFMKHKSMYIEKMDAPYKQKDGHQITSFNYTDGEDKRLKLIYHLYEIYNSRFMNDATDDIIFCDNLYFGYSLGKNESENCFLLLGPVKKGYLNASTKGNDFAVNYILNQITQMIELFEPVTEVNHTIKYVNNKPYLEYK